MNENKTKVRKFRKKMVNKKINLANRLLKNWNDSNMFIYKPPITCYKEDTSNNT